MFGDLDIRCRPIEQWPRELTRSRRASPFRASWTDTVEKLRRELACLGAKRIVIQLALTEAEIVRDGTRPRRDARPEHPGVALGFESRHGSMFVACDKFDRWPDNARAIALGLSDLRRLERYGISRSGEQYRGWKQLPGNRAELNVDTAAEFLAQHSGLPVSYVRYSAENAQGAFRVAAKRLHPDAGGDPALMVRLNECRAVLNGGAQ